MPFSLSLIQAESNQRPAVLVPEKSLNNTGNLTCVHLCCFGPNPKPFCWRNIQANASISPHNNWLTQTAVNCLCLNRLDSLDLCCLNLSSLWQLQFFCLPWCRLNFPQLNDNCIMTMISCLLCLFLVSGHLSAAHPKTNFPSLTTQIVF